MITLLVTALLMGLFGGAHCVVMCGAVSSALCSKQGRFTIAYNAGRVLGYVLLGLAAGAIGALPLGLPLDVVRFLLRTFAAVCLLTVGLHLVGLPSFIRTLESMGAPLWQRIAPFAKRLMPLRSSSHAVVAGLLWAFMPCGLLYGAALLAASSESPTVGAATMFAFGIGTLPLMLTLGALAQRVLRAMTRGWVRRVAGAVFLAFGLWSTAGLAEQVGLVPGTHAAHACCPRR